MEKSTVAQERQQLERLKEAKVKTLGQFEAAVAKARSEMHSLEAEIGTEVSTQLSSTEQQELKQLEENIPNMKEKAKELFQKRTEVYNFFDKFLI